MKVCRLCLSDNNQCIGLFTEYGRDLNIIKIISQHLWFQPLEDDCFSNLICCLCWTNLKKFNEFYVTVKIAQEKLLNHKSNDISSVQSKGRIKIDVCSYVDNSPGNNNLTTKSFKESDKNIQKIQNPEQTLKAEQKKSTNKVDNRNKQTEKEDKEIREYFQLQCQLCSVNFEYFIDLKGHYLQVHNIQRGYVQCCNRKIFKRCQILEHLDWHLNPDHFRCNICNKISSEKYTLKIHMKQHVSDDVKKYECNTCGKRFALKCHIRQHLRISHISAHRLVHKCDQCGKGFVNKSALRKHVENHKTPFSIVCDICAEVFKVRRQYERHLEEVHLGKKPEKMQCNICNVWLSKDSYKVHMKRGHDKEPNPCNLCGKIFQSKNSLQNHLRYVHESERIHKCNLCDKSYKKLKALKEHTASHTGIALYECPYCPKRFNANANMHSHRKKMHPVEWLQDRNKRLGPN